MIELLFFSYIITVLFLTIGCYRVPVFKATVKIPKTTFTIIIPYRNEAVFLPRLLTSIAYLKYPIELFEFIFVDDDSTDASTAIVRDHFGDRKPTIRLLKNIRTSNSPKKDAITTAIAHAKNEWIITTDADCELPKNWLKTLDSYIQQHNCAMIVAPVTYKAEKHFLHQFQLLDFLSLQAATIGGFGLQQPFLCNGANLAYEKAIFEKVGGFEGNNTMASGDDLFLFEKFLVEDAQKVHYLKSEEAIVTTFPVGSVLELIHQRVRWASKTTQYAWGLGKYIGLLVALGNLIIALLPLLVCYDFLALHTALSYFLLKLLFDYLLIEKVSRFYAQKIAFSTYLKSSIVYPYFTIAVVLKSLFSSYQWKGRRFKK